MPSAAASVNGAITLRFIAERFYRAVPEPGCWAWLLKALKVAPLWFVILALLVGCGKRDGTATQPLDATLRTRLTGTWAIEGKGATTFGHDGTFSSRWTNSHATPVATWEYDGVWTVTGGVCVSTITNSQSWGTTNRVRRGKTDLFKILALDERELALESEGHTNWLTRKK